MAIFGFFAMGHGADHGGCIAKTLQQGRACTATDVAGVAAYHISAFQKASQAVLSVIFDLSKLAADLFAIILAAILPAAHFSEKFRATAFFEGFESPQKISLWQWLSFHENSPNFVFARR